MKKYEIVLNEAISNFFEEISMIVKRPIEEILSDALLKQVEMISRKVSGSIVIDDENMS